MSEKPTRAEKISVGTACVLLGLIGGAYAWDKNERAVQHAELFEEIVAGNVELDLQRVNLELKLLRTISERRTLTSDESDRKRYLQDLRAVLLKKQQG